MSLSTVSRCSIVLSLTLIDLIRYKLVLLYSYKEGKNLNLETEGKISLLVTFIQRFIVQSKLSLIFTKTLLFPHKTAYFWNNLHDATNPRSKVRISSSRSLSTVTSLL